MREEDERRRVRRDVRRSDGREPGERRELAERRGERRERARRDRREIRIRRGGPPPGIENLWREIGGLREEVQQLKQLVRRVLERDERER